VDADEFRGIAIDHPEVVLRRSVGVVRDHTPRQT
jgi:hypothetical protein